MASETKNCQNCKNDFVIEPEDFEFYESIKVPPPTFCPRCRHQRRLVIRNERTLYKGECDMCKKSMISMYSPDKPFTVYCRECWFSDKWSPLDYGVDYDWSKPFFEQWKKLINCVPKIAVAHYYTNINCDYTNYVANCKNVYLSSSTTESEDIYYSRFIDYSKTCFDSMNVEHCEIIYENLDGDHNNNTKFSLRSRECLESTFIFDCSASQNCFMSSNLRNKQYVFRNKQLSKDEYKAAMQDINMGSHQELEKLKAEFRELVTTSLHKYANFTKTENCTGDNVENSKNCLHAFDVYESEDIKYANRCIKARDTYDVYGCAPSERMYEYVAGGYDSFDAYFSAFGNNTRECTYTNWCHDSRNMFGCDGARKKSYCILNKEYSKEEYEALRDKIIKHMDEVPYVDQRGRVYKFGEFFPIELGQFAYNETIANIERPLSKEEVLAAGYPWRDPDPYPHQPTLQPENISDDIKDAEESIAKEVIACKSCDRAYRIIGPEFAFLRECKIALPRECDECRYKKRFALRNPVRLWERQCMCAGESSDNGNYKNSTQHPHGSDRCPNKHQTPYAPDRSEVVYCKDCYQSEVV